jgi:hypothetical protein
MTILSTAKFWLDLGIAAIPIRYRDKRPAINSWKQYQHQLPSHTELAKWFYSPYTNIAVITGWKNLAVVDFDADTEYEKWALWVARRRIYRYVRHTLTVKTARGYHVYVTTSQPAQNAKLPGIDIKASGGYVLTPPSVHPSGVQYKIVSGDLPVRIDALSDILPPELLAQYTEQPKTIITPRITLPASDDPWARAEQPFEPSDNLIQRIKDHYRIENFFSDIHYRGGGWAMARCPFHDDRNPSLWLNVEQQICGCFAGCTTLPYDVIDLYARLNNLTVSEAVRIMRQNLGGA